MDVIFYVKDKKFRGTLNIAPDTFESTGEYFQEVEKQSFSLPDEPLPKCLLASSSGNYYLLHNTYRTKYSFDFQGLSISLLAEEILNINIDPNAANNSHELMTLRNELIDSLVANPGNIEQQTIKKIVLRSEWLCNWFKIYDDQSYKDLINQTDYTGKNITSIFSRENKYFAIKAVLETVTTNEGISELEYKRFIKFEIEFQDEVLFSNKDKYKYIIENFFSTLMYKDFSFDSESFYTTAGLSLFKLNKRYDFKQYRQLHYIEKDDCFDTFEALLEKFCELYETDIYLIDILSLTRRHLAPLPFQMQQLLVCIEHAYNLLPAPFQLQQDISQEENITEVKKQLKAYFKNTISELDGITKEKWEVTRNRTFNVLAFLDQPSYRLKLEHILIYVNFKDNPELITTLVEVRNALSHRSQRFGYFESMSKNLMLTYYILNTFILKYLGFSNEKIKSFVSKDSYRHISLDRNKPYSIEIDTIREYIL